MSGNDWYYDPRSGGFMCLIGPTFRDHRQSLLDSGRYVRSRPVDDPIAHIYPDDLSLITCHCGRIACRHHEDRE